MTVTARCVLALLILLGPVLYFTKSFWFLLYIVFIGLPLLSALCTHLASLRKMRKARREIAKGHYYYLKSYTVHFYKTDDCAVLLKAMRSASDRWGTFDVCVDGDSYLRRTVIELAAENDFVLRDPDMRAQVDAMRIQRLQNTLNIFLAVGGLPLNANATARALLRGTLGGAAN